MTPFNRLLSTLTKPWVVITTLSIIVFFFIFIDRPLAEYLSTFALRENFAVLNLFTKLGLGAIYLAAFFIGAIYFRYLRVNPLWECRMWFLWLCVLSSSIFCVVLKVLVGRARPSMWFEGHFYGFYGLQKQAAFWSFPSGHTTSILAVAFGLSILFPRHFYALVTTGLLVALSRVLLVHHYLTDILMAAYLTVLEIGLLLWVLQKKSWLSPIWQQQPSLGDNEVFTSA